MKPESIIFDIDGTLWDSRALVAEGYNQYLCAHGLDRFQVTAEDFLHLFGKTMTEIADIIFAEFPPERRYDVMRGCMELEHQVMREDPCDIAYPGVVETLEQLAKEYRLFIVSNSQSGYPELLLDKLGVNHLFQGHLCYGDTNVCKGETLKILMERHQISSAVYVGDTQGDLEACEIAQLPFVFCRFGFGQPERYDAAIDSFPELARCVENM